MVMSPVGSCGCHAQVPRDVPTTSRELTTRNAPAYTRRERPHRLNTARQANQKAPSASGRGESTSPHTAQAPHAVSAAPSTSRVCRLANVLRPMASAAR